MIQAARKQTSTSLFREAEYANFIFESDNKESYFYNFAQDVANRRKQIGRKHTGASLLKGQFLAAISQLGTTQTVNIWARKLPIERDAILSLQETLKFLLKEEKIYGAIEIHLQDAEVHSSHVQFVGINAQRAEEIIAQTLIMHGYEDNFQSATSKQPKDVKPLALPQPVSRLQEEPISHVISENLSDLIDFKEQILDSLFPDVPPPQTRARLQLSTEELLERFLNRQNDK